LPLSNRSPWTDFLLVRCDSRPDGRVVLLGDAAHTAHFSIGSGTKLAMEDAIALSQAFVGHPGDLERALVECEPERQPVVERFQQGLCESAASLHARGALCAYGPNAVRVQPTHPQPPPDAREPRAAGRHSGIRARHQTGHGRVSLGVKGASAAECTQTPRLDDFRKSADARSVFASLLDPSRSSTPRLHTCSSTSGKSRT
jgi:FAD binding domain